MSIMIETRGVNQTLTREKEREKERERERERERESDFSLQVAALAFGLFGLPLERERMSKGEF